MQRHAFFTIYLELVMRILGKC
ncbi:protein of unknown function [Candidatus Promineifilum breve]|uniref:Uncharacterized protein n=1 Tax=Candidatus Promineifilum breve TaxID=1806508 RepID=A0A160T2C1_9CHLR|nr:protein of unknown function [Candidatus Promineifilum breve]